MSLNILIFSGRVGAKPSISEINGRKKATVRVASTERYKSGGERKEKTTWLDVDVWGRTAEVLEEYVVVGQEVTFTGKLDTGSYEKDGQRHYYTRMEARQMELGAKPRDSQSSESSGLDTELVEGLMRKAIRLKENGVDEDTAVKAIFQSLQQ